MAWVIGAAVCAAVLATAVFMVGIGIAEASAIAFGFTEQIGVPVFAVMLALAVVTYGALIHLIVRAIGRSAEVPWVIWPAMAVLPALWSVIAIVEPAGVLEPTLAVLNLVGIALGFVTLGECRWTKR